MVKKIILAIFCLLFAGGAFAQEKPGLMKYGVDPARMIDGIYRGRFTPDAEYVLSGQLRRDIGPLPKWGSQWKYLTEKDGYDSGAFSEPPQPGVHPRVLMSPEDIVAIRQKIKDPSDRYTQVVWKIIQNKAAGPLVRWRPHNTDSMIDRFLVALVTEDDGYGRETAEHFMKEVDYFSCVVDILNNTPRTVDYRDSWYYYSRVSVKSVGGVAFEEAYRQGGSELVRELAKKSVVLSSDLNSGGGGGSASLFNSPLTNYDYAYNYLTEEERATARKVIAAAIRNRHTSGMCLPGNMFINNHMSMGEDLLLLALAIEGEEGYDPRILDEYSIAVRNKLTFDVSPAGNLHEKCKGFLPERATVAITKRGVYPLMSLDRIKALVMSKAMDSNYLYRRYALSHDAPEEEGHDGKRTWYMGLGSGPWMDQFFNWAFVVKHAYPQDPIVDYFYKQRMQSNGMGAPGAPFDQNEKLLRIRYTHHDLMILCSTKGLTSRDGEVIDYNEVGPPKDLTERSPLYVDEIRGTAASRSSWDEDATMVHFECRSDVFSAGHETPEANDFYIYGKGVEWSTRRLWYADPYFRNMILVDGWAGVWSPVAGKMMLAQKDATGTTFVGDATDQYNWRKIEKNFYSWHPAIQEHPEFGKGYAGGLWGRDWEVPFQKQMREYHEGYAGLDWGNWHGETRGPEMFQRWNNIDHFFRTIHLSEGDMPYVLVVDDIKKDDNKHSFDWCMLLAEDIVPYSADSAAGIQQTERRMPDQRWTDLHFTVADVQANGNKRNELKAKKGDPMLLVRVLWREAERMFPQPAYEKGIGSRVIIPAVAVEPKFRVLLYPYRFGDTLPVTSWNIDQTELTVRMGSTTDVYTFEKTDRGRSVFRKVRNGQPVGGIEAGPAAPQLALKTGYSEDRNKLDPVRELVFGDTVEITFADPGLDRKICYTLDGSEPTEQSALYNDSVNVAESCMLKARTFATYWPFQDDNGSETTALKLEKRTAAKPVSAPAVEGLRCDTYEVFMTIFDDKTGIFTGKKEMIPEFKKSGLLSSSRVADVSIPPVVPKAPAVEMKSGYYKYTGFFNAPADGEYHFKLNSCGPVLLEVGGQSAISMRGVYGNSQKDRFGTAVLKKGWHPFSLVVCDPVLWKNGAGEGPYEISLAMMAPGGDTYEAVSQSHFGCAAAELAMVAPSAIPAPQPVSLPDDARAGLTLKKYMREALGDRLPPNGLSLEQMDPENPGELYWSGHVTSFSASHNPSGVHLFTGFIRIVKGGEYTFAPDPNGANRLWIGGVEIARNRVIAPRLTGKVFLKAGDYPFRLMACSYGVLGHRQGDDLAAVKGLLEVAFGESGETVAAPIGMFAADPVKPFIHPTPLVVVEPVIGDAGRLSLSGRSRAAQARIFNGQIIDGRRGKAFKLNGGNSWIEVTDMPAIDDASSVSYWLRIDKFERALMMESGRLAEAQLHGAGLSAYMWRASGTASFDLNSLQEGAFQTGQWIHVVMTYSDTVCLYVNGELRDEQPRTNPTSLARIGSTTLFKGLDGAVEDLKLFNRVLSAEEVREIVIQPNR